jgi:hypothetical protein
MGQLRGSVGKLEPCVCMYVLEGIGWSLLGFCFTRFVFHARIFFCFLLYVQLYVCR